MRTRNFENTPTSAADSVVTSSGTGSVAVVACASCNHANASASKFCSGCGTTLWARCPNCGNGFASGEAFCGGCGVNVGDFIEENRDKVQAALTKAQELEARHSVSEAVRALKAVKLIEDRRFEDLAAKLRSEIERLLQKDEQQQQVNAVSVERVRELIGGHQYDDALRILQNIPPERHNDEARELLQTAQAYALEIGRLKTSLVESVKQNELLDLAPQFARLLVLKPNSTSLVQLAKQVGNKIARAARKRLQAFEYEKAVDLLSRVPACAVDESVERLKRQAAELRWLYDDLRLAPIVDEPLARIAARASERAPDDEKLIALCRKVSRLSAESSEDPRFCAIEYIRPPTRTHIDCGVKWLGGSKRLVIDAACRGVWDAHPGRFFVAAGLALQGVGLGTINSNLQPENSGLMSKLSLRRRAKHRVAWGIDLGETALKAVRLVLADGETEAVMDRCMLMPYRMSLARHAAELRRTELIGETLRSLRDGQAIEKSDRLCVGQPGNRVLARLLALPEAADKKLSSLIRFEVGQRTPIPFDELAWTYHLFPKSEDTASKETLAGLRRALVLTEKLSTLESSTRLLGDAGLQPDIVQSEAVALYNFAVYEGLCDLLSPAAAEAGEYIAMLDIGTSSSNLVCCSAGGLWIRSVAVGGEDFSVAAVKKLRVTTEQAEQLKRQPALAKSLSALYRAYEEPFDRLTSELRRSLDAFARETGRRPSMLLGVGGGFQLHGLMRYLIHGAAGPR